MPSSPTIALRSSAEKLRNIASMRSAEQRQASASVFGLNTLTPRSLNSRNSSRSLDKAGSISSWSSVVAARDLASTHSSSSGVSSTGRSWRRVAGIEIGAAQALGRVGQELRQQAAGAPLDAARRHALADGEPNQRRNLLGAVEIIVGGVLQVLPLQRDDALVARQVAAGIDGEGEIAVAEQRAGARRSRQRRQRAPRRSAPARAGSTARRSRPAACRPALRSWSAAGSGPRA